MVNVWTGGEAGHRWEPQVEDLADDVWQGGGGGFSGGVTASLCCLMSI